jgi:hypothetical protein
MDFILDIRFAMLCMKLMTFLKKSFMKIVQKITSDENTMCILKLHNHYL